MKAEQSDPDFKPVVITLENKEEVFFFLNLLNFNEDRLIEFAKKQISNPDLKKLENFKKRLFPTFNVLTDGITSDVYHEWQSTEQII